MTTGSTNSSIDSCSYYNLRWAEEHRRDRPPNPERVQLVCDAVENAIYRNQTETRILEVGCGNGWILSDLLHRLPDHCELIGIEPSPNGARNAQHRCPSARVECATLEQFSSLACDVIVCSEVIEHIVDQKQFARNLISRLKPGGELILTTPNGMFRDQYFEVFKGATPQPVESWLTRDELNSLFRGLGTSVGITSFDLSFDDLVRSPSLWERVWNRFIGWKSQPAKKVCKIYRENYLCKGLYLLSRVRRRSADQLESRIAEK